MVTARVDQHHGLLDLCERGSGARGRKGSVKGDGGMALHLSAGTGWLALTQFCINIVHQKAGE